MGATGYRRWRRFAALLIAIVVATGCGSSAPTTTTAVPSSAVPAASAAATTDGGPGASVSIVSPVPQVDVPEPTLTDPAAIGEALRDPARAAEGVASMLAAAGIGVYRQDGTALRPGLERSEHDPFVYDAEVLGLIEMAEADGAAIAAGGTPATVETLRAGLAELLPDLTTDQLLAAIRASLDAHPAGLPAAVIGADLAADTPLTRAQLWFLYLHGFVGIPSVTALRSRVASADVWAAPLVAPGAPLAGVPFILSPEPGVDARDYALLLAHVQLAAWLIPFQPSTYAASVHEGHGGPGTPVTLAAFHTPWYQSPVGAFSFRPLLLPTNGRLDGVPVTWSSSDAGVLNAHGTLNPPLDVPIPTDFSGKASLTYTPRKESVATPSGPVETDTAQLTASVPVRDLFMSHYERPVGAYGLLTGERQVPVVLAIEWHEEPGWKVDGASNGGRVTGQHCGDVAGDWVVDGTYDMMGMRGTQQWVITIDPGGSGGTYTYQQTSRGNPGGAPVTVTVEGNAAGSVTLTIDATTGVAHMHFTEEVHTYNAKTPPRGWGKAQPRPLEESDLDWEPDPTC
ncbi:MAG TPA: hypothetical protein VIZ22_13440 [Candidatus Limnocylindrales bacterium]